jgi:ABC-2 type transport system ATP-binding protein
MKPIVLEARNLTKRFGAFTAVDGVSFELREGEIIGLLGPNGAGKTTTIHMLLGLISQTAGEVFVFGKRFDDHREEILQETNFTAPYVSFPYRLTVLENLLIFARLYGIEQPRSRITELLRLFAVDHLERKPMSGLSSGELTRVGLCKALINRPRLLLLDEPTAYLDPEISWQVKDVLGRLQREESTTILYTSHNMAEVERMCDRVIFMNHGRIIASGTPIEITNAILEEERQEPALEEVFMRVAREGRA